MSDRSLYLLMTFSAALLNAAAAAWFMRAARRDAAELPVSRGDAPALGGARSKVKRWGAAAAVVALFYLWAALQASFARPIGLPEWFKAAVDAATAPWSVMAMAAALFVAAAWGRTWWVRPGPSWLIANLLWLPIALSCADADFAAVAGRPDDLPVSVMVAAVVFFLWVGTAQAVENDRRMAAIPSDAADYQSPARSSDSARADDRVAAHPSGSSFPQSPSGQGPIEKVYSRKVLTWPDLVYIELIAACWASAVLIVWSLAVPAPLEAPADPTHTPNPAKAPWYFVGLQELLVYGDAWWAGAVVPLLIVFGLAAIPYLDRSTQGSGYYSIRGRRFAWVVFVGGLVLLWIVPMVIGVFLRGPNWSAFGPYEPRDPRKIEPQNRWTLAQWLGFADCTTEAADSPNAVMPEAEQPRFGPRTIRHPLAREWPGLAILGLYLLGVPWLLGRGPLRWAHSSMGRARYWIFALLLMLMLLVPLKMILHWSFGLTAVVYLPEYGLSL